MIIKINNRIETITPKCALCGENLIFIQDRHRKTLEIFPCICEEMKEYEKPKIIPFND